MRKNLWHDLHEVASAGAGTLITTHYMDEALQCDRIALLAQGRVVAEGAASQVTCDSYSIIVETLRWQETFELLVDANIPASLDGRRIRISGATRDSVRSALEPIRDSIVLETASRSLEETMLLASKGI